MATRFEPAEGILAGDWYDVLRLGPTRIGMAIVDVAGHGAATGVFALRTKQLVLAGLRSGLPPGRVWQWVYRQLGDTGDLFLTGAVAIIETDSGKLSYASAGHPELLLARPGGGRGSVEMLEATGPLLGPFNGTWETVEATMRSSDVLVACTDGLTEARDEAQEEWGIEGLATVVRQTAGDGPDAVADAAFAASRRHGGGGSSPDDVTLVVLGRS